MREETRGVEAVVDGEARERRDGDEEREENVERRRRGGDDNIDGFIATDAGDGGEAGDA
jgi:hypothetical protein